MTSEGRKEAAAEELALAREECRAAEQLLDASLHRIALTRVYFAAFHAVRAALFAHGHEPRTHQGALHLFNLHFVKSGAFPPETSAQLARLQKYREQADYAEAFLVPESIARRELAEATQLVEAVARTLSDARSG